MLSKLVSLVSYFCDDDVDRSVVPMAIFNSKVEYALRAVLDLASQPPSVAVQSREIAQRQAIPEAYLDQVLSLLRRHGLVRSIRGAGGGYVLGRGAHEVTIAEVVRACNGPDAVTGGHRTATPLRGVRGAAGASVIQGLCERVESAVQQLLDSTTVGDLLEQQHSLDERQSLMSGI
jgi:Rrf2 family cysteine metabolism transcriptional repressor